MGMRELEAPAAARRPGRPLVGRLDRIAVQSGVLEGNPAGDPTRRTLYVYVPPGAGTDRLPTIYLLQGFGGHVDEWLSRASGEPTLIERLDGVRLPPTGAPPR